MTPNLNNLYWNWWSSAQNLCRFFLNIDLYTYVKTHLFHPIYENFAVACSMKIIFEQYIVKNLHLLNTRHLIENMKFYFHQELLNFSYIKRVTENSIWQLLLFVFNFQEMKWKILPLHFDFRIYWFLNSLQDWNYWK